MKAGRFYYVVITALLFLLTGGCKKQSPVSYIRLIPDSIEFTSLNPPVVITSVRSWDPPNLQYDCNQPVPYDSSASCRLDVDKNDTDDFLITISNWYEFHSASNPCYNFMYYSDISSLAPGDSVAITDPTGRCADVMDAGDTISAFLMYWNCAETVRNYWMAWPCGGGDFTGDKYCGFKIKRGTGYVFGWILLNMDHNNFRLTVKEFAINRTLNNKILAGQKE